MPQFTKRNVETRWGKTAIRSNFTVVQRQSSPKPLVLFLHGFTASMATWDNMVKELEEEELKYDILMMDFYGSGESSFLPSAIQYSTTSFQQQVNELLAVIYLQATYTSVQDSAGSNSNPDFSNLSKEEREMIPDIMLVGHSQGGIFSASYASNPCHSWVKSVLLVTPGGISFQLRDLYQTPWHIVPRTLYTAGATKWSQRIAINSSYGMLTYASFLLRGISSSFGLKDFFQGTLDYIHGFDVIKLENQERQQYLDMVASMLDHSDLLRDKKDLYTKLSARNIPLTLVLGENDAIVPLAAGKRSKQTLQYAREAHEEAVEEVVLPATHSLPVEFPKELLQVMHSAARKAFSAASNQVVDNIVIR